MNLNKVFIIGRLTADPQLRNTPGGQSVASFSLATNRVWNDKNGQKQTEVQFHNVVAWGRQAEIVNQYAKKGGMLLVEGRLQTRSWDDKQTGQKRYATEIVCEALQLGPKAGAAEGGFGGNGGSFAAGKPAAKQEYSQEMEEQLPEINIGDEVGADDIPF